MRLQIHDKITQNTQATNAILQSIEAHRKVLVVPPMGSGKTYLIVNSIKELYSWTFKDYGEEQAYLTTTC